MQSTYKVVEAHQSHIEDIYKISQLLSRCVKSANGFLVSEFSTADYQYFYEVSTKRDFEKGIIIFLVALDENDQVTGFVIGYDLNYILQTDKLINQPTSESRIVHRFGNSHHFFVIKQIGVHPELANQGIGRQLYSNVMERAIFYKNTFLLGNSNISANGFNIQKDTIIQTGVTDIFIAVMIKPLNRASIEFHEKMGFGTVDTNAGHDSQNQWGRIIVHATAEHALSSNYARDRQGAILSSLSHASSLYMHEDNLNWTKLSYLSQYMALLVAAQFFIATFSGIAQNKLHFLVYFVTIVILGIVGIYLAASFRTKLESGLRFMATHKRSALLAESKLNHIGRHFYPTIASVPRQSTTVLLMKLSRDLFIIISIVSTIFSSTLILLKTENLFGFI
jgi:GNAT superfamily N-acetyltransferase